MEAERDLLAKGADVDALRALALNGANADLQQALKKLGYAKLGERAQVIKWLKPPAAAALPPARHHRRRRRPKWPSRSFRSSRRST
jgi:hypothetical protein